MTETQITMITARGGLPVRQAQWPISRRAPQS